VEDGAGAIWNRRAQATTIDGLGGISIAGDDEMTR